MIKAEKRFHFGTPKGGARISAVISDLEIKFPRLGSTCEAPAKKKKKRSRDGKRKKQQNDKKKFQEKKDKNTIPAICFIPISLLLRGLIFPIDFSTQFTFLICSYTTSDEKDYYWNSVPVVVSHSDHRKRLNSAILV